MIVTLAKIVSAYVLFLSFTELVKAGNVLRTPGISLFSLKKFLVQNSTKMLLRLLRYGSILYFCRGKDSASAVCLLPHGQITP